MSIDPIDQKRRSLASKLVETIINDPKFREDLINDSKGALQARGVWDEYASLMTDLTTPDTSGYSDSPEESTDSNCCGSAY